MLNRAQRATPDLYFLLLPPGSATCFAHCALRSKLHCHLPRLAAAWGSGITGSGLSSPFPLLRSTQPQSGRAENFEANTHPYRIPPLLSLHIHLPTHSINTGVFRHHHLTVICLCRPPREGAVGRGPGPPPIVNYLPDNFSPLSLRCAARGYLADNLDGGWVGAWAQPGPGDTVGGGRGGQPPPPLSPLSILTYLRCSLPTGGVPLAQRQGGAHYLLPCHAVLY